MSIASIAFLGVVIIIFMQHIFAGWIVILCFIKFYASVCWCCCSAQRISPLMPWWNRSQLLWWQNGRWELVRKSLHWNCAKFIAPNGYAQGGKNSNRRESFPLRPAASRQSARVPFNYYKLNSSFTDVVVSCTPRAFSPICQKRFCTRYYPRWLLLPSLPRLHPVFPLVEHSSLRNGCSCRKKGKLFIVPTIWSARLVHFLLLLLYVALLLMLFLSPCLCLRQPSTGWADGCPRLSCEWRGIWSI